MQYIDLVLRLMLLPMKLIAGFDVFVSYSRQDGSAYSPRLAEALSARGRRLSPRIDTLETEAGVSIPWNLRLAVIWSRTLVVVATPAAVASPSVRYEIGLFKRFGKGPVQVIAIDPALLEAVSELRGLPVIRECAAALAGEAPVSDHVLARISASVGFWNRSRRQLLATALAALAVVISAQWAWRNSSVALDLKRGIEHAEKELTGAMTKSQEAEEQLEKTSGRLAASELKMGKLLDDLSRIERKTAQAERELHSRTQELEAVRTELGNQRKLAEEAREAQERADELRAKAVREAMVASAFRIGDTKSNLQLLRPAVMDAIMGMGRLGSAAVPPEMNVALTDAIVEAKRHGLPLGFGRYPEVADFDVARDGPLLLTVGKTRPSTGGADSYAATLWDVRTREIIGDLDSSNLEMKAAALSPDSKTAVVGYATGEVKLFALDGEAVELRQSVKLEKLGSVRFTSTGQHLLAWEGHQWTGRNLLLLDVQGDTLTRIPFQDKSSDLAFSIAHQSFASLPVVPPFFGVMERPSKLVRIDAESGERREFSLSAKTLGLKPGEMDDLDLDVVSPDGRWALVHPFLGVRSREDRNKWLPRLYLIDLACLSRAAQDCTTSLPTTDSAGRRDFRAAFSPDSQVLLIGHDQILEVVDMSSFSLKAGLSRQTMDVGLPFEIMSFTPDGGGVVLETCDSSGNREGRVFQLSGKESASGYLSDYSSFGRLFRSDVVRHADRGEITVRRSSSTLLISEATPLPGMAFSVGRLALQAPLSPASDFAMSPNGSWVATSHPDGQVALWSVPDRALAGVFTSIGEGATLVQWADSPGGNVLLAASSNGRLARWSETGGLSDITTPDYIHAISDLKTSRKGDSLLVRVSGTLWAVWHAGQWHRLEIGSRGLVALSADGEKLGVWDGSGKGVVLDAGTLRRVAILEPRPLDLGFDTLDFALDDSRLVAFGLDLAIWDSGSGSRLETPHVESGDALGGPHDLWVTFRDGAARLHSLRTGATIGRISGRNPFLEGVQGPGPATFAVSSYGFVAAVATPGGLSTLGIGTREILVWDDAREPVAFVTTSRPPNRLAFASTDPSLLVLSASGVPSLVPLGTRELLKGLCPLINGDLREGDADAYPDALALCLPYLKRIRAAQTPPGIGPNNNPR